MLHPLVDCKQSLNLGPSGDTSPPFCYRLDRSPKFLQARSKRPGAARHGAPRAALLALLRTAQGRRLFSRWMGDLEVKDLKVFG